MTNNKMSVEEIRGLRESHKDFQHSKIPAFNSQRILDLCDTALALAEELESCKQAGASERKAQGDTIVQLRAENEELKAENERLRKLDDPVFDATDAAHPAWWRGEKYGSQQAARKVRKILDGGDDGVGVSSDLDWEKIRRDILALKAENERLKKLTTMAEPQAEHYPGDPPWPTRHRKVWVLVYDYDRLKAENSRLSRYERAWNKIKAWAIYDERLLHKIENGCGIKEGK